MNRVPPPLAQLGPVCTRIGKAAPCSQVEVPGPRKSIGAEVNYGIRFQGISDAVKFLEDLSTEVESRMAIVGARGRTITLKLKR